MEKNNLKNRFERVNFDLNELIETKPDEYSEKINNINCLDKSLFCKTFSFFEVAKEFPGIIESIHLNQLFSEQFINIDHRLNRLRWLWDYRENIFKSIKNSFVFFQLSPKNGIPQNQLFIFDKNSNKFFIPKKSDEYQEIDFYKLSQVKPLPIEVLS